MTRPKFWYQLPYSIRETIADSSELKYDGYESSFADALHGVMCDPTYHRDNNEIVQRRYESITDEELKRMYLGQIEYLKRQVDEINLLLSGEGEA